MKAVARRERPARPDAAKASFNSVEAVVRLLTPDNRRLLALIRDRKPKSVAELVEMTGRAQPNLTRTLAKLEAAGFIRMKTIGRRKAPCAADRLAPPPPTFQSMETAQFGGSEHRCARHCSIQKGVTCQDGGAGVDAARSQLAERVAHVPPWRHAAIGGTMALTIGPMSQAVRAA